jgi:Family of unknown function (DUF6152)
MYVKRFICLVGLLAALTAVSPVSAHHSFAMFDVSKEMTLTGTINKFDWTNPHTFVWVDVVNGEGKIETWAAEGQSPNYLGRRGWSRDTVKPGDKVTMVIMPLRDGSTGGMFKRLTLPSGKVIDQSGIPK